jgi:hypothetical protein
MMDRVIRKYREIRDEFKRDGRGLYDNFPRTKAEWKSVLQTEINTKELGQQLKAWSAIPYILPEAIWAIRYGIKKRQAGFNQDYMSTDESTGMLLGIICAELQVFAWKELTDISPWTLAVPLISNVLSGIRLIKNKDKYEKSLEKKFK